MTKQEENKPNKLDKKDRETWNKLHKINNKKEADEMYKILEDVYEKYEQSRSALQSNCYWYAYQQDNSGATSTGGSWYRRWNLHDKMSLMFYFQSNSDDFESNIKSPMARGRINTFMNWLKKVNIEFGAKPNNRDDRNAAKVASELTNYWMRNSNAKIALYDAYDEMISHGSSYMREYYCKEINKNFKFPKKSKDLTKKEKKLIDEKNKRVIYNAPEETVTKDDIVLEHVPIREGYPDPTARCLHGDNYQAAWFIRKRFVSLNFLKATFGNNPNVRNLDKVKGSSAYKDTTEYFFEPPRNYMDDDIVQLLEMEDQDRDLYRVIANDIPILDQPLPYNHKQISYSKLDFVRMPGQFFSIGMCDLLENIQGASEIALNMIADYVYRSYNYKLIVNSENFGELQQALQRTDDMFIPLDAQDGNITNKVMPLTISPIGFDIFNFLELLEKNATLATGVDPAQMANLAASKTATSDILNKELLMTMVGGVVQNNTNGDLKTIGRQLWSLMQQFYSKPRAKKIRGDDKEEFVPRSIRFEGMTLKLNDKTKLLEKKETEEEYDFFEVEDKYLNTTDEVDIYITPESTEVQSQALEQQKMKENFAQLMPFAVDPNNPQQIAQHQMPMIDANKLFSEYIDTEKLPEDLLINKSLEGGQGAKLAEQHITGLLKGEHVDASPGQGSKHLEYENQVLSALYYGVKEKEEAISKDYEEKQKQINKFFEGVQPSFDPKTGQPIPVEAPEAQPDQKLVLEYNNIKDAIERIEKHIMIEAMPASMANDKFMMMKQQNQPEMGQPMPGQPGQGMEAPMPEGSNVDQINPEMINNPNPAGQVPMGQPMQAPMGGQGGPIQPLQ